MGKWRSPHSSLTWRLLEVYCCWKCIREGHTWSNQYQIYRYWIKQLKTVLGKYESQNRRENDPRSVLKWHFLREKRIERTVCFLSPTPPLSNASIFSKTYLPSICASRCLSLPPSLFHLYSLYALMAGLVALNLSLLSNPQAHLFPHWF